jgi:hypothetical protein
MLNQCLAEPEPCLLPDPSAREPWNCLICAYIRSWAAIANSKVVVDQIRHNGLFLRRSSEFATETTGIMEFRPTLTDHDEVRQILNTLAIVADEVWCHDDDRCFKLK